MTTQHRIFTTSFASVYPMYVAKAERKRRTKAEVEAVIRWLTGYSPEGLAAELEANTDFESFFRQAPKLNPARLLINEPARKLGGVLRRGILAVAQAARPEHPCSGL